ncbi:galactoside-binding lectin, partial [Teladorsagia circumcincta]
MDPFIWEGGGVCLYDSDGFQVLGLSNYYLPTTCPMSSHTHGWSSIDSLEKIQWLSIRCIIFMPVPYRSLLQEKIEPGQTLIVKGSTIDESQRFTINLHSKSADFSGNDVPLHISVRFDEGKIVMNTFANGEWGKEERKSLPIKKGDSFDIRIRAHDDRFQIVIDQKEFKDYEHRLPLTSITHLSIDGDLYLNHVHWGGKYY